MHTPRNFWMKVWNREGGPSLWVSALQSVFLSICTPKPGKHLMRDHVSTLLKCFLYIPLSFFFFFEESFSWYIYTFFLFFFPFGSTPIFPRLYRISYFLILDFLTGHVHQNKLLRLKKKKSTDVPALPRSRKLRWSRNFWAEPKVCVLSHVWLFVTLWTRADQAPLSMGFSRQEYQSGLPLSTPRA